MGEETAVGVSLVANARTGPLRWTDCEDLRVLNDHGDVIYNGPKYFRCRQTDCHELVTHWIVEQGGCVCGSRRLEPAYRLRPDEEERLRTGYYPLVSWEVEAIQPVLPIEHMLGWGISREAR